MNPKTPHKHLNLLSLNLLTLTWLLQSTQNGPEIKPLLPPPGLGDNKMLLENFYGPKYGLKIESIKEKGGGG